MSLLGIQLCQYLQALNQSVVTLKQGYGKRSDVDQIEHGYKYSYSLTRCNFVFISCIPWIWSIC